MFDALGDYRQLQVVRQSHDRAYDLRACRARPRKKTPIQLECVKGKRFRYSSDEYLVPKSSTWTCTPNARRFGEQVNGEVRWFEHHAFSDLQVQARRHESARCDDLLHSFHEVRIAEVAARQVDADGEWWLIGEGAPDILIPFPARDCRNTGWVGRNAGAEQMTGEIIEEDVRVLRMQGV